MKNRRPDRTLSSTQTLFFCICGWFLFKTAASSLLLNRVLFLVNSGPSSTALAGAAAIAYNHFSQTPGR